MKLEPTQYQAMEGNWIYTFLKIGDVYAVRRSPVQLKNHAPSTNLLTDNGWESSLSLNTPAYFPDLHEAEVAIEQANTSEE